MYNNKAVSPIIATITLLAITLIISISIFQFLQDYSLNTEELATSNALLDDLNTRVVDVNEERGYIQTPYDNLNISRVILDGVECSNNSGISSSRTLRINLSSCSGSVTSKRSTLTIETNEGVIQKQIRELGTISSVSSSGSSLSSCFNSSTIGSVGTESPCTGMLIVNRTMLDSALDLSGGEDKYITHDGTNYTFGDSANNVFTGQVIDMSSLFSFDFSFDAQIGYWDTRNVVNMSRMFFFAQNFNQSLDNFDTSSVTDMHWMFNTATSFNQSLGNFDTSSVVDMTGMFYNTPFNQPLSNFDTSSVTDMNSMFNAAVSFNQPLDNFDTSSVIDMFAMFDGAESFNQSLSNFNTSSVTNMNNMFSGADSFDQNISMWIVDSVTLCTNFNASTSPSWTAPEKPNFTSC